MGIIEEIRGFLELPKFRRTENFVLHVHTSQIRIDNDVGLTSGALKMTMVGIHRCLLDWTGHVDGRSADVYRYVAFVAHLNRKRGSGNSNVVPLRALILVHCYETSIVCENGSGILLDL